MPRGRLPDLGPSTSRSSSQSSGWFDALTGEVIDQLQELEEPEPGRVANTPAAGPVVVTAVAPVTVVPWTFQKADLRYPPPPPPNPPVFTDKMDNAKVSIEHRNGTCDPCVLFNSSRGCAKGNACRFCHLGNHATGERTKAIQRPRKQARDKYKSVVQKLLAQMELNPQADQAHEELQTEARKSPYVWKLLQGYLDGIDSIDNIDLDPPPFGMMPYQHMPVQAVSTPFPAPMHQSFVHPLGPPPHLAIPRPLYSR